jgi:protein TIF31
MVRGSIPGIIEKLVFLANINKLGHEDHIPGQVRDWNEELQITKELSKKTLPERLIRERAMFKVG